MARLAPWFVLVAALVACDDGSDGASPATTTAPAPSPTTAAPTGQCRSSPDDVVDDAATSTLGPSPGIDATTAPGEPLTISGTVFDEACAPLAGTSLNVWQTDGEGVYGPGHDTEVMQCCYLQGTVRTDAYGRYQLVTVMPGHYRGEREPPPAHIHVEANHPSGRNAMLEIVFAGDPQLDLPAADGYVVVTLTGDDEPPRRGVADLVLSGADATAPITAATAAAQPPPLPPAVEVRQEPDGVALADPAFVALPGARADFGRLGGAAYQIEMPAQWNGRLVLWMHGFEDFASEAGVSAPDLRAYLVAQGYAWGASSFSSTSWIPGRATDETAALWDHFASSYGRPERTYVVGLSMGGAAGHIAAERHADRFDGVLALCGAAGATPALTDGANQFVAAAYAAGVTQAEFDATVDVPALIRVRIRPALEDASRRDRYERIMVDLTGGPRPFDREGFRATEDVNWGRLEIAVAAGVIPRREEPYDLGPLSDVSTEEFNAAAIRLRTNDDLLSEFVDGNEVTGALRVPLLTLHSTGDGQVPIEQARILRRRVDAAGAGDLLVQRVIRDAGHCGFTTTEWLASFEALVAWVEEGVEPASNDLLGGDLEAPRPSFELQPRAGLPDADSVPGAGDRMLVRGRATIDGAPFSAPFLGAVVLRDGLMTACQLTLTAVTDGHYELTVIGEDESVGCGAPGAHVVLWTYAADAQLYATNALTWLGNGLGATFDVAFSTATPQGVAPEVSSFVGEILGTAGRYVEPGTRVEAYVGSARCGITSTRYTGSFSGYVLFVVGQDAVPGCAPGATLTFRVDGQPAAQTALHEPGENMSLDLTMP